MAPILPVAAGDETILHVGRPEWLPGLRQGAGRGGADVNAPGADAVARTPIHLARFHDHAEISEYLMANGVVLPKPEPISTKAGFRRCREGPRIFRQELRRLSRQRTGQGRQGGSEPVGGRRPRQGLPRREQNTPKTLQAWEGVWTYEDLSTYLYGPTLTTPGVLMETPGVPDETERVDLIAYLRTLSDTPQPLP